MICTKSLVTRHPSLVTFFGMIPNFEPEQILPKLASLVRPKDFLLFSANLAPGKNYAAGMKKILPQYDNPLTRDWLMTFLLDLGIERSDGELRFKIETDSASGLKRIVAGFHFTRPRRIEVENEAFDFRAGEAIRLFFSYRYTPERVHRFLAGMAWKSASSGLRNPRKKACSFAAGVSGGAQLSWQNAASRLRRDPLPVKKPSSCPARP